MNVLVVLLCFKVVHCASLAHEPQCSKFHYEEQLLEKMIRMEVKVEDIEKRMLQTNDKVLKALGDMRKERKNMNNEYEDLKIRYKKDMEERITTISKQEEKLLTETVAFKARGPVDKSLDTGQVIVLAETMFNYGDAYDDNTGIFIAPVGGTYLFTIHLCILSNRNMYYGIMVDNKVQTSGLFYDNGSVQCYSADAILVLKGGERVYVKCLHSSYSDNILYEYSTSTYNYWNTFSGVLIHSLSYLNGVLKFTLKGMEAVYVKMDS